MNILLITDSYPPEIRSASHLMQELAEGLRARGHRITVTTSYPQYNLPEDWDDKRFNEFSVENGITVLRVKTLPHHKVSFIIRGLAQLTMPYLFISKINKYTDCTFDAVVVYSPPLPLARVGRIFKAKHGAKFIFNVQDIFPQNAVDLGILKKKIMINFFEKMERTAYAGADMVTVHSESNRAFLIRTKKLPGHKIQTLHNWVDLSSHSNGENNVLFRKKYKLENKFVFLFAGVIGPSQGLHLIIEGARTLRGYDDICFLLMGNGSEKDALIKKAMKYNLDNVVFSPFISKSDYLRCVREMDVGVVCLSNKNRTPVVPGKILGYMAASVPVAAFLNRESDGHKIIEKAQCGYSTVSGDLQGAVAIMKRMYSEKDRLPQYGKNGFEYAKNNFSRDVCLDNLEKILNGGQCDRREVSAVLQG